MLVYGVQCQFEQYFSYIVAVSFIGGGNRSIRGKPLTCCKSLTNFITWYCIEYTLSWAIFNLTLAVIGTDCTSSCKSNNHMIMTKTDPINNWKELMHINLLKEEFEDTKGEIRIHKSRRTDNTMTKRKSTKAQTTIYKTYT